MKILKSTFLFVLFFINSQSLLAQTSFGIRTGYTVAKSFERERTYFFKHDEKISRISFSILTYYKLNENIALGFEPGYLKRGVLFPPSPSLSFSNKFNYNYLELPVNFSFSIPIAKEKLVAYTKLGYSVSVLVSIQNEVLFMDASREKIKIDLEEAAWAERLEHGINTSFGLGFIMGEHQLFLESTFYFGKANSRREPFLTSGRSKFNSTNIGIGYLIKI